MTRALRWALRIAGWLLVVGALLPSWSTTDQGPGGEEQLRLGFADSPLFVRTRTVIHAGVANVPDEQVMKSGMRFEIASLSMLALIVGALLVSASNRRT